MLTVTSFDTRKWQSNILYTYSVFFYLLLQVKFRRHILDFKNTNVSNFHTKYLTTEAAVTFSFNTIQCKCAFHILRLTVFNILNLSVPIYLSHLIATVFI